MRHRSRTRRVLKWVSLGASFLAGVTWAASSLQGIRVGSSLIWCETLGNGMVVLGAKLGGSIRWIQIEMWFVFLVTMAPTALLWCLDWLHRQGRPPRHCQTCGYDLTGNVSGICPECGTPIERRAEGT
jgi:hypothetical protein